MAMLLPCLFPCGGPSWGEYMVTHSWWAQPSPLCTGPSVVATPTLKQRCKYTQHIIANYHRLLSEAAVSQQQEKQGVTFKQNTNVFAQLRGAEVLSTLLEPG